MVAVACMAGSATAVFTMNVGVSICAVAPMEGALARMTLMANQPLRVGAGGASGVDFQALCVGSTGGGGALLQGISPPA